MRLTGKSDNVRKEGSPPTARIVRKRTAGLKLETMKLPHFLLLCACISTTGFALAQGNGRNLRDEKGGDRGGNYGQQNDLNRERQANRERYERMEPQRDPRDQMSPEERRQLKRDVNDAGREIYRRSDRY